jgi:hypothetical protein
MKEDKIILISIWSKIEKYLDPKGFSILFEENKKNNFLITEKIYEKLKSNKIYHNFNLYSSIKTIISKRDDEEYLIKLSLRHQKWGIKYEDFEYIGKIIFDVLKDYLNEKELKIFSKYWFFYSNLFTSEINIKINDNLNQNHLVIFENELYNIKGNIISKNQILLNFIQVFFIYK